MPLNKETKPNLTFGYKILGIGWGIPVAECSKVLDFGLIVSEFEVHLSC